MLFCRLPAVAFSSAQHTKIGAAMTNGATVQSTVAGAAFRALSAWLFIYAIISQLLVIPKWILEQDEAPEVVEVVAPQDIREQEQRIQLVQRLVDDIKEVEARHEQVVASAVDRLERLHKQVMKPLPRGKRPQEPPQTSPELSSFQQLMKLATLSDIEENRLLEMAENMQKEVDVIAASNATISWPRVISIATARYERKDPTRTCPSPQPIDPSIARESHLYQKFQQAEKILKQRAEAIPPILHQERVVTELRERASNPPPAPKTTQNDGRMCVSQQDVEELMDEGLEALKRRQDLRRVLIRSVLSKFEVNKQDLILDAPLDAPKQPVATAPSTINLRQVMDVPLLKEMESWIDLALDHVGGHFDSLDQLVDKLAADESSVGKVLISKLQTLAGKIDIPNIWAYKSK